MYGDARKLTGEELLGCDALDRGVMTRILGLVGLAKGITKGFKNSPDCIFGPNGQGQANSRMFSRVSRSAIVVFRRQFT